jgi:NDP-sugar pyrophosphorylase family protein
MLKIVIPLAGTSDLFINAGFYYPKPLIESRGKTLIEWVIQNPLKHTALNNFLFVIREEDVVKHHLDNTLKLLSPKCEIVILKNTTRGSLCSVLMSIDFFGDDDELLILNGDQVINFDFNQFYNYWHEIDADAGLVLFESVHPRWSYARLENNFVVETAEKNPISNKSIAGYYYFKNTKIFFENAFEVIFNDVKYEENFFISPVINQYILKNLKVGFFEINKTLYHSFYSPQMLIEFERQKYD